MFALFPISHTRAARAICLMTVNTSQSDAEAAAGNAKAAVSLLRLPRAVLEDLRAHGEETWPRECCGALLGKPLRASLDRKAGRSKPWCAQRTRARILRTTAMKLLRRNWSRLRKKHAAAALKSPASITRIPTTRHNGRPPTLPKRIGWARATSSRRSPRGKPQQRARSCWPGRAKRTSASRRRKSRLRTPDGADLAISALRNGRRPGCFGVNFRAPIA